MTLLINYQITKQSDHNVNSSNYTFYINVYLHNLKSYIETTAHQGSIICQISVLDFQLLRYYGSRMIEKKIQFRAAQPADICSSTYVKRRILMKNLKKYIEVLA